MCGIPGNCNASTSSVPFDVCSQNPSATSHLIVWIMLFCGVDGFLQKYNNLTKWKRLFNDFLTHRWLIIVFYKWFLNLFHVSCFMFHAGFYVVVICYNCSSKTQFIKIPWNIALTLWTISDHHHTEAIASNIRDAEMGISVSVSSFQRLKWTILERFSINIGSNVKTK